MLAPPSTPLGRVEDTVVIGIHPVKLRRRPPRGALLGALDVLLFREATGWRCDPARGRCARWSCCLLTGLSQGGSREQGQGEKSGDDRETHLYDLQLI